MIKGNIKRADLVRTYIEATGHSVEEVAAAVGYAGRVADFYRVLYESCNKTSTIVDVGKYIGIDLTFLLRDTYTEKGEMGRHRRKVKTEKGDLWGND